VAERGKRIAVLFHARERDLDPRLYLVGHLAELWREDGFEVVYLYGTDRHVPADLLLVHYTVRNGEAILLDASPTIGPSTTYIPSGTLRSERRRQADGIYEYFDGREPL
jgi:hypothetical protein